MKIDVAKLNVAKPVKDAAAAKATTTDSAYTVANTEWTAADGTILTVGQNFNAGTVYTVKITLKAKRKIMCSRQIRPTIRSKGKDAKLVTAVTGYTDSVILTYTFDATEGTYVPTKPAITTVTLPDGKVGDAYSQTLAATGTNPITWGIEAGTARRPDAGGRHHQVRPPRPAISKFTVEPPMAAALTRKTYHQDRQSMEAAKYPGVT